MREISGVTKAEEIVTRGADGMAPKSSAPIYRRAPTLRR